MTDDAPDDRVIGVGPHTRPWPEDDRYDPELLRDGDRRNVVDRYRYWTIAAIRADLAARAHRLHIAIECHACFDWLFPVLEMFRHAWPEIDVDIRAGKVTSGKSSQAGAVPVHTW